MAAKEQRPAQVLAHVLSGAMELKEGAAVLGVSVRRVWPVYCAFRWRDGL